MLLALHDIPTLHCRPLRYLKNLDTGSKLLYDGCESKPGRHHWESTSALPCPVTWADSSKCNHLPGTRNMSTRFIECSADDYSRRGTGYSIKCELSVAYGPETGNI